MKTNNLSKRRVRRIVNCFAAGLTAIDTSFKLKLHRNTINKYYRQIREAIAAYESERLGRLGMKIMPHNSCRILWHKNQGLCLNSNQNNAEESLVFHLVNADEKIYVLPLDSSSNKLPNNSGSVPATNKVNNSGETDAEILAKFTPLANRFYHYSKEKLTKFYGVKPQYTFLYLQELEFRFNNHDTNISNLILKLLADQEKGFKEIGDGYGESMNEYAVSE
ncbi:MAG: hypothetical protein IPM47_09475 [Sphingobacteriales bacterium]|nr:MAG: hypothetical protein IPM47_09475 [Sphingobacteriales bacterium]